MEPATIYERIVDFESLRKDDMDVEPEIVAAGWRKFFQVRETIYLNEIYDFWKNMQMVDNTIVSEVDRLSIIVTTECIVKVTECPSAGEKLISKPGWMTKFGVNEKQVNQQLYGDNDSREKNASSLVLKARVLHSILSRCILPRSSSTHLVTALDEQFLFYLLNHQAVDLPFLIFQYMVEAKKDLTSYPYGMMLTKIFRRCGVLLDNGIRRKWNVKRFINSATFREMALKNLDRENQDSEITARTEVEDTKKRKNDDRPSSSSDLREEIVQIRQDIKLLGKEMKEMKEMMREILKHFRSL